MDLQFTGRHASFSHMYHHVDTCAKMRIIEKNDDKLRCDTTFTPGGHVEVGAVIWQHLGMEEEESNDQETNAIAALRYFSVGDPECAVCEKRGTVVRITTTLNRKMLITMMCEKCGTNEIDGIIDRGDMQYSGDRSHLVSHALASATESAIKKAAKEQREALIQRKKKGGNKKEKVA